MPLTPEHLEAFTAAGDPRFVFAAWRDEPNRELYYLEEGLGAEVRQLAKAELQCFVPGCEAPRIVAVAPAKRRHHFRHLRRSEDGLHGAESVSHLQGKAAVAAWLRRFPGEVAVEQALSDRKSIPDVLWTAPNGKRVAFEIQYSAITVASWRERQQRYVNREMACVWLFGHTGPNLLRHGRVGEGPIAFTDAQKAIVESGALVLWINPETGEIAIAVQRLPIENGSVEAAAQHFAYCDLRIEPLSAFTPSALGLDGPIIEELRAAWRRVRVEKDRQATVQKARLAEVSRSAVVMRAIDAAARRIGEGEPPLREVLKQEFEMRGLGEPSLADHREAADRRSRHCSEKQAQERRIRARRVMNELAKREDLIGVRFGQLCAAIDAAMRAEGLGPSRRLQQRWLERQLEQLRYRRGRVICQQEPCV